MAALLARLLAGMMSLSSATLMLEKAASMLLALWGTATTGEYFMWSWLSAESTTSPTDTSEISFALPSSSWTDSEPAKQVVEASVEAEVMPILL